MHNLILTDMKLSPTELIPVLRSTLSVLSIYILKYMSEDGSLKTVTFSNPHQRSVMALKAPYKNTLRCLGRKGNLHPIINRRYASSSYHETFIFVLSL